MKNLSAIADRAVAIIGSADPAQFETAFAVMKDETVTNALDSAWYSEITLMSELGVTEADAVLTKIESAVSPRIGRMIQSEKGINLADPQTMGMLTQLKGASVITQAEYDSLVALTSQTVNAWPNLKPGHVQTALRERAEGLI